MKTIEELFDEIQEGIIDPEVPLSTTLRKAQVLAYQLDSDELRQWVRQELDGYSGDVASLPDYRNLSASSQGTFINSAWKYSNASFPTGHLPDEIHKYATTFPVRESVREVESWIETCSKSNSPNLGFGWPPDFVKIISQYIFTGMTCVEAHRVVNKSNLEQIIETVRNRLLDFILELRGIIPEADRSARTPSSLATEEVKNVFNTWILQTESDNVTVITQRSNKVDTGSIDLVTTSIFAALLSGATTGVGKVAGQAVVDGYQKLKGLLVNKYGKDSEVVEAVGKLETRPESKGRQQVVQEEVVAAGATEDEEIRKAAQELMDHIQAQPEGKQHLQIAIGNYIAISDQGSTSTVSVNSPDK